MKRLVVSLASVCTLSACSSPPPFDVPIDVQGGPTVSSVIDKIECEISEAAQDPKNYIGLKGLAPFDQWVASVALTLTVNDTTGTATAGLPLSYIDPLKATGTLFTFGASPVLYETRTRTYAQNYTINIAAIPKTLTCEGMKLKRHGFDLEGDLGLREQIYMGLHSFTGEKDEAGYYQPASSGAKALDNFGATVQFHIYKGITGVGPTWTLQTFKGPSAGVGYVRDDQHQVVITFAPTAGTFVEVPPKPTEPSPPKEHKGVLGPDDAKIAKAEQDQYRADMADYNRKRTRRAAAIAHNAAVTQGAGPYGSASPRAAIAATARRWRIDERARQSKGI
ncbi:hypothetical protein [Nitrobacter sp. JJSN]|uniref:hypothetical protein n=1 Tax=Nitrobacter sp. JJSN TaxID=3453033 RepID=UPI003F764B01